MFEIDFVLIVNTAVVITALVTLWYSIHLISAVDHTREVGWWTVLPIVILYGVIHRTIVLATTIGFTPCPPEWISAMILPLWVGLLIFVRGLYGSATELKELQRSKE